MEVLQQFPSRETYSTKHDLDKSSLSYPIYISHPKIKNNVIVLNLAEVLVIPEIRETTYLLEIKRGPGKT